MPATSERNIARPFLESGTSLPPSLSGFRIGPMLGRHRMPGRPSSGFATAASVGGNPSSSFAIRVREPIRLGVG